MSPNRNGNALPAPAVDRAVLILETLAAGVAPLGVSEISRRLHLNKSTVHDILVTLARHHLVERDQSAKTYRLGWKLTELAQHANRRHDLRGLAHQPLVALAHTVAETVFLGAYHNTQILIVDKEEAPHDFKITSPLGRRLNYAAGAFGKIFLAALTEIEAHKLMRTRALPAFTPNSIVKTTLLREELRKVRTHGYALDDEEYLTGVRATAAPVNDARGRVVAALCVVGMKARLPMDKLLRITKAVRHTAEEISRQLGAVEYPTWKGIG